MKMQLLLVLVFLSANAYGQKITIVTEENPPYNYKVDGEVVGVSVAVVEAVLKEVDVSATINSYPWPRAYKMALENENTLIFSISRIPTRENSFKWIGEIAPSEFYLFSLRSRDDIEISNLQDAKKYSIGTVKNEASEQFLTTNGFSNIQSNVSYKSNLKKLLIGRIDLWPMAELVAYEILKSEGHGSRDILKKAYKMEGFSAGNMFMAFSQNTPDKLVEEFREALKTIKTNGIYQKILDRHLQ